MLQGTIDYTITGMNPNSITGLLAVDLVVSICLKFSHPFFFKGKRDFFWQINTTPSSMYRETYCFLHEKKPHSPRREGKVV
jgi:hypothetical protein